MLVEDNDSFHENCKIVSWAINTTGTESIDEICELAAYTSDSTFSQYIMPYGDVKWSQFKRHGLKEYNTKILRILWDYGTDHGPTTRTEMYALKDFVLWLKEIKRNSGYGVILISHELQNYKQEILLESLRRCKLNEEFFEVVKGFVNCYELSQERYGQEIRHCTLVNVYNMIFDETQYLIRALAQAEACYKVFLYVKERNEQNSPGNRLLLHVIKPDLKNNVETVQNHGTQDPKENKSRKRRSRQQKSEKLNSQNKLNVDVAENKINKPINNQQIESSQHPILLADYSKFKAVGWAINVCGTRVTDRIFHIAAFSSDSSFHEYIMPRKLIKFTYYRERLRVVKTDGIKQLQDMNTDKFLDTKSEMVALTEFITWLEILKGENLNGILILYHEYFKHSIAILLQAIQRCNLIERFVNVVKGFVNVQQVVQDKCAHSLKLFSLNNVSELLLKKRIRVNNPMARAEICYEIIKHLAKEKIDNAIHNCKETIEDDLQILSLIQPFVTTISDEENEIVKLKEESRKKSKLKRNSQIPETNIETEKVNKE